MVEDGYVFLLAFALVGLAAGGAFLIRRSVLSKAEPIQRRDTLPHELAERMAAVRRSMESDSPEEGRQATMRQRVNVGGKGSGGRGAGSGMAFGEGGGVRPLSRRSFLVPGHSTSRPLSPPREDSPLLGSKQGDEEKEAAVDWGDVEDIIPVPAGSENGDSETGSRRTTASAAPTTLSTADAALLGTFMEVLADGLPIKIHRSSKRPRKTTLWLKDTDTLVWASKRAIGTKQLHKLNLGTVTSVQAGKGGSDSLIIGSGESADEDACFSLSFPSVSMGFEAASELERDALVQGFAMLVEDLKAEADEQRYRDAETGVVRDIC